MKKQFKGVIIHEAMLQGDSTFDTPSVANYLQFYRKYPELLTADVETFNTWDEEDRISGIVPDSIKEEVDAFQIFSHEDWDATEPGESILTVIQDLLPEYELHKHSFECIPNDNSYEYTVVEIWK